MSVTVSDLLNLPSLRQAEVIAGHNGLNRIITSISVLESVNPSVLIDGLFGQGEFFGSEIVITGFINCTDDVECQCANIKRLAEGGEVGLILFYVGIYMPCVDQKLIDLANELDFVLIQMPPNKDLRYAEVISDVNEYIFNDRAKNDFIVSDILARVSGLPEYQRTVNTVLRMVSDGVRTSLILTDASDNVLNLAGWPKSIEEEIISSFNQICAALSENKTGGRLMNDINIYQFPIIPDMGDPMKLFLVKEGAPLSKMAQTQVSDIVRICINIWGEKHGTVAVHELIRAILQDDPLKMHRLAEIFHINISEIHEMWILSGMLNSSPDILKEHKDALCDYIKSCSDIVFSDTYENDLIIFSSTPYSEKEAERGALSVLDYISEFDSTVTVSKFSNLQNTTEVRKAYLCCKNHLHEAKKIFPVRRWFSSGDLEFARDCHNIIDRGEEAVNVYTSLLERLNMNSDDWNAADTLAVYMLDSDFSATKTAKQLHVHINTVKYRLKIIDNLLGFSHDKMPDNIKMYYAAALGRMMK